MSKLLYMFFVSAILSYCDSNDSGALGSDKIIGEQNMISNTEDNAEIATDCTKKNTFIFASKGILRRNLQVEVNAACTSKTQEISSQYNLGKSIYRIDYSNGIIDEFEFNFTQNCTKFSLLKSRSDGAIVVSTFEKK